MRIKKNDQVVITTGKDRGKKGRVMQVFPKQGLVLVEKINYRKVAVRKSQANPKGGILEMEGKIHISKVQLICPRTSKPTKVGYSILKDGTKSRICKVSQEVLGEGS